MQVIISNTPKMSQRTLTKRSVKKYPQKGMLCYHTHQEWILAGWRKYIITENSDPSGSNPEHVWLTQSVEFRSCGSIQNQAIVIIYISYILERKCIISCNICKMWLHAFFSCKDSIFMELRDIRLNNDCIYLYIEFEFNSRFI